MSKIDHPSHYNIPGKKECIEQMRDDLGDMLTACFCLGNAYKYAYRAGEKAGESSDDDMAKSHWYMEYFISNFYRYVAMEMTQITSAYRKVREIVYGKG